MLTFIQMCVFNFKTAEQCLQFFWCEKVMEQAFFPAVQRHKGIRFDLLPGFGLILQSGNGDKNQSARLYDAGNFIGNPFDGGIIAVIDDLDRNQTIKKKRPDKGTAR